MGATAPESTVKDTFSTTEAADFLRVPPVLLRWLIHREKFDRGERRGRGGPKPLRRETVQAIDRFLADADPEGRFRSRSAAPHRGRRAPNRSNYTTPDTAC